MTSYLICFSLFYVIYFATLTVELVQFRWEGSRIALRIMSISVLI